MASKKKLLQAAAGAAGGAGLDVDEVFSTYLYDGTGSAQTITNGIDLSGEGGLVWAKSRTDNGVPTLYDTARGTQKPIFSSSTSAEGNDAAGGATNGLNTFNSNGFTIGADWAGNINVANQDMVSWTWRKAPKFFDVVQFTVGSTGTDTVINHSLGSDVGMVITKLTSTTSNWGVHHRDLVGANEYMFLNTTGAAASFDTVSFSSTQVDLGTFWSTNNAGETGIAYIFAHNNSDGGFGPDADQDVIKCGSYTGNGSSTGPEIDLGFEPQWIMIKKTNSSQNAHWYMFDAMRGIVTGGDDPYLYANNANAEVAGNVLEVTPTGFQLKTSSNGFNGSSDNYIYMAIRRGPLAEPESATDVFIPAVSGTNNNPSFVTPFNAPDYALVGNPSGGSWYSSTRLLGSNSLDTSSTSAQASNSAYSMKFNGAMDSFWSGYRAWMWKRAPSFFDVVAYSGNGSTQNVSHNLGAVPEMIWIKSRNATEEWKVYHSAIGNNKELVLSSAAASGNTSAFNNTTPTSSVFSLGASSPVNDGAYNFIAYLFATVAGVSKVGSYTGTGSAQNIDCGFSSGARFIIIKRTDSTGAWFVFDTVRGIVAGNDPVLNLNSTGPEEAFDDLVDPYSSGFSITSNGMVNTNNGSYIFYAIA